MRMRPGVAASSLVLECTNSAQGNRRVPYVDVCDDADYSQRAKGYHEAAESAGVPAITTAGSYYTTLDSSLLKQ